jgi:ParB family chromosome partitioning protein
MNEQPLPNGLAAAKRRGLGRGLDALFEDTELRVSAPNPDGPGPGSSSMPPMLSGGRVMIPITHVYPGAFQPRRVFTDQAIHELAQSIAQHGIIQPLLVRPSRHEDGQYEIIAGERRWRAAMKAGVHEVPVVINTAMTDREALQLGLIENIQRQDLTAIEEAEGYQRLINEFDLSPERIGEMIGKSRSHVANTLRLMQLPQAVQKMVLNGALSAGHARALIGHPQAEALATQVIDKKLSVRQIEKLAARLDKPPAHGRGAGALPVAVDPNHAALERRLSDALGLRVEVVMKNAGEGGTMKIDFTNLDQLDLVIKKLEAA